MSKKIKTNFGSKKLPVKIPSSSNLAKSASSPSLISSQTLSTLQKNLSLADDILSRALSRADRQPSALNPSPGKDLFLNKSNNAFKPLWQSSIEEFRQGTFAADSSLVEALSPASPQAPALSPYSSASLSFSSNLMLHGPKEHLNERATNNTNTNAAAESPNLQKQIDIRVSSPETQLFSSNNGESTESANSEGQTLKSPLVPQSTVNLKDAKSSDHPPTLNPSSNLPTSLYPDLEVGSDISLPKHLEREVEKVNCSSGLSFDLPRQFSPNENNVNSQVVKSEIGEYPPMPISSNHQLTSQQHVASLNSQHSVNLLQNDLDIEKHLTALQILHDKIIKMNMTFLEQHNNMLYHTSTTVKHQAEEHRKLFQEMIENQTSWQVAQAHVIAQTSTSLIQSRISPTSSNPLQPSQASNDLQTNISSAMGPMSNASCHDAINFSNPHCDSNFSEPPMTKIESSHSIPILPDKISNAQHNSNLKDNLMETDEQKFHSIPEAYMSDKANTSQTNITSSFNIPKKLKEGAPSSFSSSGPPVFNFPLDASSDIQKWRAELHAIAKSFTMCPNKYTSSIRNLVTKKVQKALGGPFDYTSAYQLVYKINEKLFLSDYPSLSPFVPDIISHLKRHYRNIPSEILNQSKMSPLHFLKPATPTKKNTRSPIKRANISCPVSVPRSPHPVSISSPTNGHVLPRPNSPLRPPNPFYQVRLSQNPIFLRRTSIKPPCIPSFGPPKPPQPPSSVHKRHVGPSLVRYTGNIDYKDVFKKKMNEISSISSVSVQTDAVASPRVASSSSAFPSAIPVHISRTQARNFTTQRHADAQETHILDPTTNKLETDLETSNNTLRSPTKNHQAFASSHPQNILTLTSAVQTDAFASNRSSSPMQTESVYSSSSSKQTETSSQSNPASNKLSSKTKLTRRKNSVNVLGVKHTKPAPPKSVEGLSRKNDLLIQNEKPRIQAFSSPSLAPTCFSGLSQTNSELKPNNNISSSMQTDDLSKRLATQGVQMDSPLLSSTLVQTQGQDHLIFQSCQTVPYAQLDSNTQTESTFMDKKSNSQCAQTLSTNQHSSYIQTDSLTVQILSSLVQTDLAKKFSNMSQTDDIPKSFSIQTEVVSSSAVLVQTQDKNFSTVTSVTQTDFSKPTLPFGVQTFVPPLFYSSFIQTEAQTPTTNHSNSQTENQEKQSFSALNPIVENSHLISFEGKTNFSHTTKSESQFKKPLALLSSSLTQTDTKHTFSSSTQAENAFSTLKLESSFMQTEQPYLHSMLPFQTESLHFSPRPSEIGLSKHLSSLTQTQPTATSSSAVQTMHTQAVETNSDATQTDSSKFQTSLLDSVNTKTSLTNVGLQTSCSLTSKTQNVDVQTLAALPKPSPSSSSQTESSLPTHLHSFLSQTEPRDTLLETTQTNEPLLPFNYQRNSESEQEGHSIPLNSSTIEPLHVADPVVLSSPFHVFLKNKSRNPPLPKNNFMEDSRIPLVQLETEYTLKASMPCKKCISETQSRDEDSECIEAAIVESVPGSQSHHTGKDSILELHPSAFHSVENVSKSDKATISLENLKFKTISHPTQTEESVLNTCHSQREIVDNSSFGTQTQTLKQISQMSQACNLKSSSALQTDTSQEKAASTQTNETSSLMIQTEFIDSFSSSAQTNKRMDFSEMETTSPFNSISRVESNRLEKVASVQTDQFNDKVTSSCSSHTEVPLSASTGVQTKKQKFKSSSIQSEEMVQASLYVQTLEILKSSSGIQTLQNSEVNPFMSLPIQTNSDPPCSSSLTAEKSENQISDAPYQPCIDACTSVFSQTDSKFTGQSASITQTELDHFTTASLKHVQTESRRKLFGGHSSTKLKNTSKTQSQRPSRKFPLSQTDPKVQKSVSIETEKPFLATSSSSSIQTEHVSSASTSVQSASENAFQTSGTQFSSMELRSIGTEQRYLESASRMMQTNMKYENTSSSLMQTEPIMKLSVPAQTTHFTTSSLGPEVPNSFHSTGIVQTEDPEQRSIMLQTYYPSMNKISSLMQTESSTTLSLSTQTNFAKTVSLSTEAEGFEYNSTPVQTVMPIQISQSAQVENHGQRNTSSTPQQTELTKTMSTTQTIGSQNASAMAKPNDGVCFTGEVQASNLVSLKSQSLNPRSLFTQAENRESSDSSAQMDLGLVQSAQKQTEIPLNHNNASLLMPQELDASTCVSLKQSQFGINLPLSLGSLMGENVSLEIEGKPSIITTGTKSMKADSIQHSNQIALAKMIPTDEISIVNKDSSLLSTSMQLSSLTQGQEPFLTHSPLPNSKQTPSFTQVTENPEMAFNQSLDSSPLHVRDLTTSNFYLPSVPNDTTTDNLFLTKNTEKDPKDTFVYTEACPNVSHSGQPINSNLISSNLIIPTELLQLSTSPSLSPPSSNFQPPTSSPLMLHAQSIIKPSPLITNGKFYQAPISDGAENEASSSKIQMNKFVEQKKVSKRTELQLSSSSDTQTDNVEKSSSLIQTEISPFLNLPQISYRETSNLSQFIQTELLGYTSLTTQTENLKSQANDYKATSGFTQTPLSYIIRAEPSIQIIPSSHSQMLNEPLSTNSTTPENVTPSLTSNICPQKISESLSLAVQTEDSNFSTTASIQTELYPRMNIAANVQTERINSPSISAQTNKSVTHPATTQTTPNLQRDTIIQTAQDNLPLTSDRKKSFSYLSTIVQPDTRALLSSIIQPDQIRFPSLNNNDASSPSSAVSQSSLVAQTQYQKHVALLNQTEEVVHFSNISQTEKQKQLIVESGPTLETEKAPLISTSSIQTDVLRLPSTLVQTDFRTKKNSSMDREKELQPKLLTTFMQTDACHSSSALTQTDIQTKQSFSSGFHKRSKLPFTDFSVQTEHPLQRSTFTQPESHTASVILSQFQPESTNESGTSSITADANTPSSAFSQTDTPMRHTTSLGFQTELPFQMLPFSMQTEIHPGISTLTQTDSQTKDISSSGFQTEPKPEPQVCSTQTETPMFFNITKTAAQIKNPISLEVQTEINLSVSTTSMQTEGESKPTATTGFQTEPKCKVFSAIMQTDIPSHFSSVTQTDSKTNKFASSGFQTESKPPLSASFVQTEAQNLLSTSDIATETRPHFSTFKQTGIQTESKPSSFPSSSMRTEALPHFSSLTQTDRQINDSVSAGFQTDPKPFLPTLFMQTETVPHFSTLTQTDPQIARFSSSGFQTESAPPLPTSCMQTETLPHFSTVTQTDNQTARFSSSGFQTESTLHITTPLKEVVSSDFQTDQAHHASTSSIQANKHSYYSAVTQTDTPIRHIASLGQQTEATALDTIASSIQTDPIADPGRFDTQTQNSTISSNVLASTPPSQTHTTSTQTKTNLVHSSIVQTENTPLNSQVFSKSLQTVPTLFSTATSQTEIYPQLTNSAVHKDVLPMIPSVIQSSANHESKLLSSTGFQTPSRPYSSKSSETENRSEFSSSYVQTGVLNFSSSTLAQTTEIQQSTSYIQTNSCPSNSFAVQTSTSPQLSVTMQTEKYPESSSFVQTHSPNTFSLMTQTEDNPALRVSTFASQTVLPAQLSVLSQTFPLTSSEVRSLTTQADVPVQATLASQTDVLELKTTSTQSNPPCTSFTNSGLQTEELTPNYTIQNHSSPIQVHLPQDHALCQTEFPTASRSTSVHSLYPTIISVATQAEEIKEVPAFVSTQTQVALSAVDDDVKDWVRHQFLARALTNTYLQSFTSDILTTLALATIATEQRARLINTSVQTTANPIITTTTDTATTFSPLEQISIGVQAMKPRTFDFTQNTLPVSISDHGIQVTTMHVNEEIADPLASHVEMGNELMITVTPPPHIQGTVPPTREAGHLSQQTDLIQTANVMQQTECGSPSQRKLTEIKHQSIEASQQTTPVPEKQDHSLQTSRVDGHDVAVQRTPSCLFLPSSSVSSPSSSFRLSLDHEEMQEKRINVSSSPWVEEREMATLPSTVMEDELVCPLSSLNTTVDVDLSAVLRPCDSVGSLHGEESSVSYVEQDLVSEVSDSMSLSMSSAPSTVSFSEGEILPFSKRVQKKRILGQLQWKWKQERAQSPGELSSASFQISNSSTLSLLS